MRGRLTRKAVAAAESTAEDLRRASADCLADISKELESMAELLERAVSKSHRAEDSGASPASRAALNKSLDQILTSLSKVTSEELRGCRKLDLLVNIGAMYESMGMFEDAFDCYLGALTASRTELNALGKAEIELKAAGTLCGLAEWSEAEKCLASALETFTCSGDKAGAVKALILLGRAHYQQGRYHSAKANLGEGIALAREMGDEKALADLSNMMGLAFALAAEHGNSICSFQDALAYYQRTYDYGGVAEVYHNMARVHIRQKRLNDAAASCDKSLIICEKISDHSLLPFVTLTKAEIAWEQADYIACASFCRRGMELLLGWGGPLALGKVNRILGDLIARVMDWDHAKPFYRNSGALYASHGVRAGEAWIHVASARSLEEEGRNAESLDHLVRALRTYQELELDRDAASTAKKISAMRGQVPAK